MRAKECRPVSINFLQVFKYVSVGVLVNGGGYALFLVFLLMGLEYKISASITYFFGCIVSFLLNRKLVFESAVSLWSGFFRLFFMLLAGYFLNILLLYVGVGFFNCPASMVQLVSIVCVSIFFYLANKFFVHVGRNL